MAISMYTQEKGAKALLFAQLDQIFNVAAGRRGSRSIGPVIRTQQQRRLARAEVLQFVVEVALVRFDQCAALCILHSTFGPLCVCAMRVCAQCARLKDPAGGWRGETHGVLIHAP